MGKYQRLPAIFMFAKEIRHSTEEFTIENEDAKFASVHVTSPIGQDVGRVYICGTLTQVEDIGNDTPYYKGRLVDPTGAISVYAGQYQPDAVRSIEELEVPVWVAIIGKISIFTTEDGTKIPSIRAESISKIDEDAIRTFTYMAASNMITHIEHETTDMKTKAIELYGDLTSEYKAEAVTALKSLLPPSGD